MISKVSQQVAVFDDSKRIVANLMARENITVQTVDGIPTASFNPVTRVLSIPAWAGLTVEQVDTLMSHEIGHALFSDDSIYAKIAKDKKSLFTYVNVVEDARIERKMRESFPGLSRVFFNGYQKFTTDGPIFKIADRDHLINHRTGEAVAIASMKLIDRLNTYYKIGAFVNVPFDATERIWIDKIDRCGSMDQAIEIARQLHQLAREQDQQNQNPSNEQNPEQSKSKDQQPQTEESGDDAGDSQDQDASDSQDDQDGEGSESDDESSESEAGDESDESDESKGSESGDDESDDESDESGSSDGDDESNDESNESGDEQSQAGESQDSDDDADGQDQAEGDESEQSGAGDDAGDQDGAETVEGMEEMLRQLAQKNAGERPQVRNLLIAPISDAQFAQRTVSASDYANMAYAQMAKNHSEYIKVLDGLASSWEDRFLATAKHMALEFDRRKTAKVLQHAKVGKTGKLDLSKLSQYRFTEDLFKRTMNVPNGKSHGVVMIIDGSGSMSGCIKDVLDQVLLFAYFAYQVNIPFEAYMFTTQGQRGYATKNFYATETALHTIMLSDSGSLVGLVNTRADRAGFKRQVRTVCALRQTYGIDTDLKDQNAWEVFGEFPYQYLGGTPLYTGMMLGEKALANMKREARLDKTTFIVVSDGQDGNGLQYLTNTVGYGGQIVAKPESVGTTGIVVRDTVTKRTFTQVHQHRDEYYNRVVARCPQTGVLTMLMDVIKARHDARTIYLYLQSGGYASYGRRYRRWAGQTEVDGQRYIVRAGADESLINAEQATKDLRDNGQYVFPKDTGAADLTIILRQSQIAMDEAAFSKMDVSGMTQRKIASEFTKAMVKNTANRVFINTVVPHLA